MSLVTDCLGFMSFDEMADTAVSLGYETLEFACVIGQAPHIDLDVLIESSIQREKFVNALKHRGFQLRP